MPAKKKKGFVGGKKKKGDGIGGDGPFDDEAFERDLLLAMEESRRMAGLAEEQAEMERQAIAAQQEQVERMAAQEAQMRAMQDIDIEITPECAVCMMIMVRPSQLPCKHVFCQTCAMASMNFKWECPMCRFMPQRDFRFDVSEQLIQTFKEQVDPEAWEEREQQVAQFAQINVQRPPQVNQQQEESKEGFRGGAAAQQQNNNNFQVSAELEGDLGPDSYDLKIKYGNRHRTIDNAPMLKNGRRRNHEWTMFVQLEGVSGAKAHDLFKSVMFILPPCYQNRYRCVEPDQAGRNIKNWFHCKEVGWGTVNVQIEIQFFDELGIPPVRLQHMTKFTPMGDSKVHKVRIPRAVAEALSLIASK